MIFGLYIGFSAGIRRPQTSDLRYADGTLNRVAQLFKKADIDGDGFVGSVEYGVSKLRNTIFENRKFPEIFGDKKAVDLSRVLVSAGVDFDETA